MAKQTAFDTKLLYALRESDQVSQIIKKGVYQGKYFNSTDIKYDGRDGQLIRYTYDEKINASVVEILPLSKPTIERYNDNFQKSYGKIIASSRNTLSNFVPIFHSQIKNKPVEVENSTNILLSDLNVLFSEKSKQKINNMVVGNELVKVLENLLSLIKTINKDISTHVHPNVSNPLIWRTTEIENQIQKIKDYLPNILSEQNFLN